MQGIAVIIVTHDSRDELPQCLEALAGQSLRADRIIIVDSGSTDTGYLQACNDMDGVEVVLRENIGFGRANNVGLQALADPVDSVLFLNPDAFPQPDVLERAQQFLQRNPEVGCSGGRLLAFDPGKQQPTGLLDSTGVFRTRYCRWVDRGQGEPDDSRYLVQEDIPVACGAFLFCRRAMLDQVALAGGAVFDPDFFLYKEDIDLCLRIWKQGWRIVYLPGLRVHHCRGWQGRRKMSRKLRLTAASSEILLNRKHPSPCMVWAILKYLLVRWLRI